MIITEQYRIREDGVVLNRTYSDAGVMILQVETGIKYVEAIDVMPCKYTYEETDEPIEAEDGVVSSNEATVEDYQDALGEFGVTI